MSGKNPKHKKKITEEDLKKHLEERNKKVVEKDNTPTFKPKKKVEDQVIKKDPGTNIHRNKKGEVVVEDEKGIYRPIVRKQTTLSQGKKKSPEEYVKEQKMIEEIQSDDLGLRAPLHYLANPDHMLGDLGNLTGFKPLQNFNNSDKDAKRYNFQSLDPSKSKNERFKNNLNEGLNLVPSAAINLGLATMATKGNLSALKEAYNPIPLPFGTSPKYNVEDQFKYIKNQSDSVNLLESQKFLPNLNLKEVPKSNFKSEINWSKWNKEIPENAQLMKEYNAIEQTSKANGSWMKNSDGSTFQGTPEQFVQQNSENFKKAFPDYYGNKLHHRSKNEFNTFDESKFGSTDEGYHGKGIYTSEDAFRTTRYGDKPYELYVNVKNKGINPDYNQFYRKDLNESLNTLEKNYLQEKNLPKEFPEYYPNIEKYNNILDTNFEKDVSGLIKNKKQLDDHDLIKVGNEVVIPFNNPVKSAIGNNGMFDMTNPNIYKSLAPIGLGATYLGTQENNKKTSQFALGGNLKQQTNNNMLNEFNEGGSHEQNPLGGVPQGMGDNGQMNTVEQGETKKDSFIYSNRITLTPQVIAQFNLPKSLSGKTAADATKLINNKFEGRNSKIDNNTKKAFLDRIAEAQETVKAEEQAKIQEAMQVNSTEVPDMMNGQIPQGMEEFVQPQQQMFNGGELSNGLSMLGASGAMGQHTGLNQATTALDLGNTAFGSTGIDTSGATDVDPGSIKPGMMGVTGALKGAQAGSMFGPIGTGVGAAIGLGAGLIGGGRAKKDALRAHQNFEIGQSNKKISDFAFGGLLGEPVLGEPTSKNPKVVEKLKSQQVINNVNTMVNPNLDTEVATSRLKGKIVGIDESIDGKYIYYKPKSTPGFNPETDRDYVLNKNWETVRGTDEYLNYLRNRTKSFAKGGNMYEGGGPFDKSTASYDPTKISLGLPQQQSNQFLDDLNYAKNLNNPNKGMFYKQFFGQRIENKKNPYADPSNYETNKIKNYHDALGITPNTPGYGTAWGDKSNTLIFQNDAERIPNDEQIIRMQKEGKTKYSSTKEDILNGKFLKRNERWGLTPEGSKYKGPQSTYYTDMGKNISNDLGYTSKLNYNDPDTVNLSPEELTNPTSTYSNLELAPENVKPNSKTKLGEVLNKTGQYVKNNYGNALRYAPVAMNAYQLAKMGKPEVETLDRLGNKYNPQYMDEKALTNQINAETNYTANALANASNGSLGSLSNNILGMQLNKSKALSDAYSKVADVNRNENKTGQQFNLGVDQFNVGQSNQEKDINARNRGAFKTERSKLLGQIGNDLGNIGKEQVYKKLAGKAFGYSYDGEYLLKPDGTKVSEEELDSTIKTNLSSVGATEKDGKYFDTTGKEISKEEVLKMIGTQKTFNKNYQGKFSSMNTDFGNISLTNNNKQ